jgi:hypothetical protein
MKFVETKSRVVGLGVRGCNNVNLLFNENRFLFGVKEVLEMDSGGNGTTL